MGEVAQAEIYGMGADEMATGNFDISNLARCGAQQVNYQ